MMRVTERRKKRMSEGVEEEGKMRWSDEVDGEQWRGTS